MGFYVLKSSDLLLIIFTTLIYAKLTMVSMFLLMQKVDERRKFSHLWEMITNKCTAYLLYIQPIRYT